MCFSNLPIEFDEAGNPYLAEEADAVDRPPEAGDRAGTGAPDRGSSAAGDPGSTSTAECGCAGAVTDDVALDEADPETMFASIMETMPSDVRDRVAGADGNCDDAGLRERREPDAGMPERRESDAAESERPGSIQGD